MFLLVDNYDSFTYNLVQYFQSLGEDPVVRFNDDPSILELAKSGTLDKVVLSPGPSHPANAGLCLEFLKLLPKSVPVLGVCLGHQVLGLFAGAPVEVGPVIMHGMQSDIVHDGTGLYHGLPNPLRVGRYHSLVVVSPEDNPNPNFTVTARGPLGEVMSLVYNDRPWAGVQFHPESVLTKEGMKMLANFPDKLQNPACAGKGGAQKAAAKPALTMAVVMERLASHQDLTDEMAKLGFDELMDGKLTPAQAGAFLMGLRAKGESPLEVAYAVQACIDRAVKVSAVPDDSIDIVGTGGDGRNSFNCSTVAALTMAGMGYNIIKHGNRAVSSTCGAADALEGLGIPLPKDPEEVLAYQKKTGFGFFFAPYAHPAFKNIGPLRRELGIRTLFNMLGPMINPARPPYLLMGVARPEMLKLVAETLSHMPHMRRTAVVHGAGGYDEVTTMGPAQILLLDHGKISPLEFDPAKYGFKPCTPEEVAVHSREEAISVLKELLQGGGPKPMQDMAIVNAGLAIYLAQPELGIGGCIEKAAEGLHSGAGRKFVHGA